MGGATIFMSIAPRAEAKVARLEGREAEPELEQQRQQERGPADGDAEHIPAEDRGPEGRQPEQGQVDGGTRGPARMPAEEGEGQHRDGARADQDGAG